MSDYRCIFCNFNARDLEHLKEHSANCSAHPLYTKHSYTVTADAQHMPPCPFCGTTSTLVIGYYGQLNGPKNWSVKCLTCDVCGPPAGNVPTAEALWTSREIGIASALDGGPWLPPLRAFNQSLVALTARVESLEESRDA